MGGLGIRLDVQVTDGDLGHGVRVNLCQCLVSLDVTHLDHTCLFGDFFCFIKSLLL